MSGRDVGEVVIGHISQVGPRRVQRPASRGWRGTVAGPDESMSRTPFLDFNARSNARLGDRTLLEDWAYATLRDAVVTIAATPRGLTGVK